MGQILPLSIGLWILKDDEVKYIRPIKVLDTLEGKSKNFHPDGLFSVETFGKVGEARRQLQSSYFNLNTKVFHPAIYKTLIDLKNLYENIMNGTEYAAWDDSKKDFEKSDALEGKTGFSFFLEHFNELRFEERESDRRHVSIQFINKYRNDCLIDKYIVLPAGLRDFEIDDNGKPSEDEVNEKYRSLFSMANTIPQNIELNNAVELDYVRYRIQVKAYEIYQHFEQIVNGGKKKFILGKWTKRKIQHGTRNVVTSLVNNVDELDSPLTVGFNDTVVGMYQFMMSVLPLTLYYLKSNVLYNVFQESTKVGYFINKETWKREPVELNTKDHDDWLTNEGLEKIISKFSIDGLRFEEVEVGNHYLALIYKGPDTYKIFYNIDDLPKNLSKEDVKPITLCELLYCSIHEFANKLPEFVTRYPAVNYGSIYPSFVYLKSTTKSEIRTKLEDDWTLSSVVAYHFPIIGSSFIESMSPHPSKLARLDMDFDGDTASGNIPMTEDAIEEVRRCLNNKEFYIAPAGKLYFSVMTDTIKYVLQYMTGD